MASTRTDKSSSSAAKQYSTTIPVIEKPLSVHVTLPGLYPDNVQDCDINIQTGTPPVKSLKEAVARMSNGKYKIKLAESEFTLGNGVKVGIDAVDSALVSSAPHQFLTSLTAT